jgi:hypothetical protein
MNNDLNNNPMSLEEARKILGKTAKNLSNMQLQDEMAKIDFLVESWLDDYERTILKGKTLNEFLT